MNDRPLVTDSPFVSAFVPAIVLAFVPAIVLAFVPGCLSAIDIEGSVVQSHSVDGGVG